MQGEIGCGTPKAVYPGSGHTISVTAIQYEAIRSHCADMWDWLSERYASGLESSALDVEALRRDGTFSEMATQYLYWIRLDINRGQWMLDTVQEQIEQVN